MSAQENRALLRRYIREVWEERNPAAVRQFLALYCRQHTSTVAAPLTLDDQLRLRIGLRTACPNIRIVLEEVISERDHIALRSEVRGTHQGACLGIAPTGKQVTVGLVDVIRVENGRFAEQWGEPDLFDLLRQWGRCLLSLLRGTENGNGSRYGGTTRIWRICQRLNMWQLSSLVAGGFGRLSPVS